MDNRRQASEFPDVEHLQEIFRPHVESFDYFTEKGLEEALMFIPSVKVTDPSTGLTLRIGLQEPVIQSPMKEGGGRKMQRPLLPRQCREGGLSYSGRLTCQVTFQYDHGPCLHETMYFGQIPIMLKSKLCHLRGADVQKLIKYKEEGLEMGGYFICNGYERLVRLLIMPKRNHPMALERSGYRGRQDGFTDKAVLIRCVREDQSAVTMRLYYLQNGSARVGFRIRAREYLLPVGVVLKALKDASDHEIFRRITGCESEKYQTGHGAQRSELIGERARIILDELKDLSLLSQSQCLNHIGKHFHVIMEGLETESHALVGEAVLRHYILVHLKTDHDKFNLLIFMLQKLFAVVDQTAAPDNSDALQNHEVLLPGHLIAIYLKEKLQEWLYKCRQLLSEEIEKKGTTFNLGSKDDVKKVIQKTQHRSVANTIDTMLRTGKLATSTGLDLPQRAGMTIDAERLNFLRFISHFQSVHRGAFFGTLRSTTVRKLLPESWGFLCPVHTPDGTPCGLLNHLTSTCRITSYYDSAGKPKNFYMIQSAIINVLVGIGMVPALPHLNHAGPPHVHCVLLDGRIIGSISSSDIEKAASHIRKLKLLPTSGIPTDLEIGYVPSTPGGAYPGLYLSTSPSRFVRPVRNISQPFEGYTDIELIGPFEQAYMEIKCADGGDGGRGHHFPATHEEIHPTGMLSVVANLTPWSDHNQSPRNMYQCQMAKQTMGFSLQSLKFRADHKLYHLQTPQSPIVRTKSYTRYCIDDYPLGTNAIVAVLAYTGYDMEDAMILNKSSVERGMCNGYIYQVETVDLTEGEKTETKYFRKSKFDRSVKSSIDSDGLPYIGQTIQPSQAYCSAYNKTTDTVKSFSLKGSEPVIVDKVVLDGIHSKESVQKVDIRFRHLRNPIIGDKFSSRHGQKGVCSQLWPDIDMPFSGMTGMRPDLIINPHAFPSRMTIGMLLESIAAKGGSLHGKFIDATPFPGSDRREHEGPTAESGSLLDELGPMLTSKGFNYHGTEVLYSGVLGTELVCEIFIGPVYYQRLRHMVSDKFQVRATGPVDPVTRQPIKGRKAGGGIRFGEMERDSLLAHGAAYLLHDRLHTCSDYHIADVCSLCGSILSSSTVERQQQRRAVPHEIGGLPPGRAPKKITCHACKTSKGMETVAMPYVFRYLAAELAAMNIKVTLQLSNGAAQ